MPNQSHVFVTLGSVTNIACDAWLLPTDQRLSVRQSWIDAVPDLKEAVERTVSSTFSDGDILALPLENWSADLPLPVLTAVPLYGLNQARELLPALRSFIRAAAAAVSSDRRKRKGRPNALLAMPLFGTGGGGAHLVRGEFMKLLLEETRKVAAEEGVDVVLVLQDERDFALAQELRKRFEDGWWSSLEPRLQPYIEALADVAKAGRLVPFMGSGISVSAGGPTWSGLIESLATLCGLNADEVKQLQARGTLDQANVLRTLYEESSHIANITFNEAVAAQLSLARYGLAPALLASLPADQAITLNYDDLFEKASRDAGKSLTVIPGREDATSDRWLLKLHGSVTEPESIVLTRDDYLGYNASRDALSALVKATLITHRLLFVGFGLADDHFHEIVHAVRKALPPESRNNPELATALTLFDDQLDERAWRDKLTLIPMSEDTNAEDAARILEIFLDALLAHATDSHSYLLSNGYKEALTPAELSLREKLLTIQSRLTAAEVSTSGGRHFVEMLGSLGYPQTR